MTKPAQRFPVCSLIPIVMPGKIERAFQWATRAPQVAQLRSAQRAFLAGYHRWFRRFEGCRSTTGSRANFAGSLFPYFEAFPHEGVH